MASVVAVCISERKGTQKHEVPDIQLKINHGIVGDAHAGNWHRQVSLLGQESVEKMKAVFPDIPVGAFAENILTEGLTLYTLPVGTRLQVGEVLLEVTQIGKECHAHCVDTTSLPSIARATSLLWVSAAVDSVRARCRKCR